MGGGRGGRARARPTRAHAASDIGSRLAVDTHRPMFRVAPDTGGVAAGPFDGLCEGGAG